MKSLERRFRNIQERNIFWGSYLCFAEAVKSQNFSKQTIHHWFTKLINPDDYARNGKREILSFLTNLSSPLRTIENQGQAALPATQRRE